MKDQEGQGSTAPTNGVAKDAPKVLGENTAQGDGGALGEDVVARLLEFLKRDHLQKAALQTVKGQRTLRALAKYADERDRLPTQKGLQVTRAA